jgi:hypothetical protein
MQPCALPAKHLSQTFICDPAHHELMLTKASGSRPWRWDVTCCACQACGRFELLCSSWHAGPCCLRHAFVAMLHAKQLSGRLKRRIHPLA